MSERRVISTREVYLPAAAQLPDPCPNCGYAADQHIDRDIEHGMVQYTCPDHNRITAEDLEQARDRARERLKGMTFE